jgi:urease accessory protein
MTRCNDVGLTSELRLDSTAAYSHAAVDTREPREHHGAVRRRFHAAAVATLIGGALLSFTRSATAHTGTGLPGGIVSGFNHPFAGFDHLLAMVSVGLWGAVLGPPLIYSLPVIFPAVMVSGAVMGMLGVPIPPVEMVVALSVLVLGICIALSIRAPVWAASLIVATFAVFHGYTHGKELPSAADPVGYSSGFVLATGLLHLLGIGIGYVNHRSGGMIATRSVGAAIAGTGVWFFYRAVGT